MVRTEEGDASCGCYRRAHDNGAREMGKFSSRIQLEAFKIRNRRIDDGAAEIEQHAAASGHHQKKNYVLLCLVHDMSFPASDADFLKA